MPHTIQVEKAAKLLDDEIERNMRIVRSHRRRARRAERSLVPLYLLLAFMVYQMFALQRELSQVKRELVKLGFQIEALRKP